MAHIMLLRYKTIMSDFVEKWEVAFSLVIIIQRPTEAMDKLWRMLAYAGRCFALLWRVRREHRRCKQCQELQAVPDLHIS